MSTNKYRAMLAAPAAQKPVPRADGWVNLLTGLGDINRDKRAQTSVDYAQVFDRITLTEMYRGDDVVRTGVDLPVDEMLRQGFDIKSGEEDEGNDLSDDLKEYYEKLDGHLNFSRAGKWGRLYGGAAIIVGADDGLDPAEPLNEQGIRSIKYLTTLDRFSLLPVTYYNDPLAPKYGEVETYRIMPVGSGGAPPPADVGRIIHESRLIRFGGADVPNLVRARLQGWSDSIVTPVFDAVRDYAAAFGGVSHLMMDFSQGIYTLRGVADALASDGGSAFMSRLTAIDMSRSMVRATILDEGEEFKRDTTPLAGVADVLEMLVQRLAQAWRIPVTLLMGQSPAGLSATGDADIRFFYDHIKTDQETMLRPRHSRLFRLIMLAADGPTAGAEPDGWRIHYRPLWQMSETEKATLRNQQAQTDQIYINTGVVDPAEIAISRFGGDEYSAETQLDFTMRDKAGALPEPEPSILEQAKAQALMGGPPADGTKDPQGE